MNRLQAMGKTGADLFCYPATLSSALTKEGL